MGNRWGRSRWRGRRGPLLGSAVLVAASSSSPATLVVLATLISIAVFRHPPEPPLGVHIPWYVLTLLFAATEAWVFHIQFGREAKSISISEIPLVIGLFYTTPGELLLARIVGPALVVILYRRQTALKAVFNISLFYADAAVALAVFRIVGGGSHRRQRTNLGRRRPRRHPGHRRRPGAALGHRALVHRADGVRACAGRSPGSACPRRAPPSASSPC